MYGSVNCVICVIIGITLYGIFVRLSRLCSFSFVSVMDGIFVYVS